MDRCDRLDLVGRFFSGTGSSYNRVVRLATLGFDYRWKKKIVGMIPAGSARIIDQACGTGILTLMIARRFPQAGVTGIDVTEGYLQVAKKKVAALGLANIALLQGRAEDVLPEGACDCVTSSYLAKYADLPALVSNIKKMLRPGGLLIMHDFTYPRNRVCAAAWRLYFRLLQGVGARLYPEWKTAFDDLPGLLLQTDWVGRLKGLLGASGFGEVRSEDLPFGAAAIVSARAGSGQAQAS
jgi:demethylmenaquinone methyltransferase/2-methoxy-6-polyprenyl-1,4-benzoquinol methylase